MRDRWVLAHGARSVLDLAAFVLLVTAASAHRTRDGWSSEEAGRAERMSHTLPG